MKRNVKQACMENNALEEQLNEDNKTVMTDIICYLRSANLSMLQVECVRKDIALMLLEGQRSQQDAHEILGEDYEALCDAIIAELPKQTRQQRVCGIISIALLCFSVLALIEIVMALLTYIQDVSSFPYLHISYAKFGNILVLTAVSYYIVKVICIGSFHAQDRTIKLKVLLGIVFVIAFTVGNLLLFQAYVVTIHIAAWCAFILLAFFLSKVFESYSA